MTRRDFRAAAARRLSEERELPPAIVSLLSPDAGRRSTGVKVIEVDHIDPNPEQPRLAFDETSLEELAASIREHGVLQPILVRPVDAGRYQLIAGERRWRASKIAARATIPALVEDIDDDTALEISIIENLQREDISPLDEASMYERMVRDHGYSIRKLAEKLGKDKGYLENRLRLADAPPEIRDLVSVRKDTLSHAYEHMAGLYMLYALGRCWLNPDLGPILPHHSHSGPRIPVRIRAGAESLELELGRDSERERDYISIGAWLCHCSDSKCWVFCCPNRLRRLLRHTYKFLVGSAEVMAIHENS